MSPTGRPEGEHRSAQHEGAPLSAAESVQRLAVDVGAALARHDARLVLAESCTGGLVAAAITDVAGSSGWFDRGFVTYSNAAKVDLLGVAAATLEREGAVSEATAREMAMGALARSGADCAAAVTGIAGPAGGSAAKPVGTVCFAWVRRGAPVRTATMHFPGDRPAVRAASVAAVLQGVLDGLGG